MEIRSWEESLAAIGVSLKSLIAGAIGSFVALNFLDSLSKAERWSTFMGGWGLAAWGSDPLAQAFELQPKTEAGVALLLGLLGMSVASKLLEAVKQLQLGPRISALLDRFFGSSK